MKDHNNPNSDPRYLPITSLLTSTRKREALKNFSSFISFSDETPPNPTRMAAHGSEHQELNYAFASILISALTSAAKDDDCASLSVA